MHNDELMTRTLTPHTPEDPLDRAARPPWEHDLAVIAADLLEHVQAEAANTPARPEPRCSDLDFMGLLLETSIPVTVGEYLWGL